MAKPTMTLIGSQVLVSPATSVTFSSIPQTYTDLRLVCSTLLGSGGSDYALLMQFNGDTSSNYSYTFLRGSGSSGVSCGNTTSTVNITGVNLAGGSSSSGFASSETYIPNYTSAAKKQIAVWGVEETNSTAINLTTNGNSYRGTSAITSIYIFNSGGSPQFIANSSFYLYGINNS